MFSSHYKRTLDTLAHFAMNKNKKIVEIEAFCERRIGGWIDDFDGFARKKYRSTWKDNSLSCRENNCHWNTWVSDVNDHLHDYKKSHAVYHENDFHVN
jgi:hypothetical protein